MSSSDIAISVRGLSKVYTINHDGLKKPSFREVVVDKVKHPFRKAKTEQFWALKDVSFEVKKGDVVGIIGRNGAGKSTLLKILSRIVEPTSGEVDLYGRVGSLLEVGTGFHPELTGRENVFLNGAILGMRRAEIKRQFDAIVDFAEVERFLDTPVKRYSSGMYVRLAFAVAAHLNPEVLIVDEVLAVGDANFQRKCLGKMREVATGGRTVLFVSHTMSAVQTLCTRAVLLKAGSVQMDREVHTVIAQYQQEQEGLFIIPGRKIPLAHAKRWGGSGKARFVSVTPFVPSKNCDLNPVYSQGDLGFRMEITGELSDVEAAAIQITDQYDRKIVNVNTLEKTDSLRISNENIIELVIRGVRLRPGRYKVGFWLGKNDEQHVDVIADHCSLEILPPQGSQRYSKHDGVVQYDFDFSCYSRSEYDQKCAPQACGATVE
jgi:lipopolysaccharide transport system ATP-binding protein